MSKQGKQLASGRSARWALMEKFEVPDYDHPERNYLTRYRLIQTPLFGIYLHKMDGPDPRITLHDHPWTFRSFILRGGYVCDRLNPITMQVEEECIVKRMNFVRAHECHTIRRLLRVPTWTLVFVGRKLRTWGYMEMAGPSSGSREREAYQWVWTEFDRHKHAIEFEKALEQRKAMG